MFTSKLIATCFGIGYIQKGAGTLAALFYCGLWWWLKIGERSWMVQCLVMAVIFLAGVIVSGLVENEWGHDSNKVVIDEVSGMSITLFFVPLHWLYVLIAFVLFRFFDIAKPLFIRRMEALPKGWGVMMDDMLAGIYSFILLQLFIQLYRI